MRISRQYCVVVFIMVLSYASATFSDADVREKKADAADSKTLLASIMPSSCHFSGDFSQGKNIPSLPVPLVSSGHFFFSCDLGVIWQTVLPFDEALIYNNNNMNFRLQRGGEPESLDGLVHYGMSKILRTMLSGNIEALYDNFEIEEMPNVNAILLNPKNKRMQQAIEKISIEKLSDGHQIITIHNKNQQSTKITINNVASYYLDDKTAIAEQCAVFFDQRSKNTSCNILRYPHRYNQ